MSENQLPKCFLMMPLIGVTLIMAAFLFSLTFKIAQVCTYRRRDMLGLKCRLEKLSLFFKLQSENISLNVVKVSISQHITTAIFLSEYAFQ